MLVSVSTRSEFCEHRSTWFPPGTGLGQSFLYEDDAQSLVLSSEGGHGDFAPTSEEGVELLRYLHAEFG